MRADVSISPLGVGDADGVCEHERHNLFPRTEPAGGPRLAGSVFTIDKGIGGIDGDMIDPRSLGCSVRLL